MPIPRTTRPLGSGIAPGTFIERVCSLDSMPSFVFTTPVTGRQRYQE